MKWISVKDRKPHGDIIVAICGSRQEQHGDPIETPQIVFLRNEGTEWRTMDCTEIYFESVDKYRTVHYWNTIEYWMPWQDFILPDSLILKKKVFSDKIS